MSSFSIFHISMGSLAKEKVQKNKINVSLEIVLLNCFKIFIRQNHFNFFVGGWEINLAQNNNRQN